MCVIFQVATFLSAHAPFTLRDEHSLGVVYIVDTFHSVLKLSIPCTYQINVFNLCTN
jgi:hypothetical protein